MTIFGVGVNHRCSSYWSGSSHIHGGSCSIISDSSCSGSLVSVGAW